MMICIVIVANQANDSPYMNAFLQYGLNNETFCHWHTWLFH